MLKVDIKNISRKEEERSSDVLKDIRFTIMPGKCYTILGRNGSGKTTLIKSLTGLLNDDIYHINGNVLFNNEDISAFSEQRLQILRQKHIRYVLQDLTNNFDPLKRLKYYFDFQKPDIATINYLLKEFLLPDYEKIGQLYAYEISGGMAQRLSFLLAILPKPDLLILDEPTSAIDYTNINLIKLKLEEMKTSGKSSLIVTQDIQFAEEISDEIAFLSERTLTGFRSKDLFFAEAEHEYSGFLKAFRELK